MAIWLWLYVHMKTIAAGKFKDVFLRPRVFLNT